MMFHVQYDRGKQLKVISVPYDDSFCLQDRKSTKSLIFQIWHVELKMTVQKSFFEASVVFLPASVKIDYGD